MDLIDEIVDQWTTEARVLKRELQNLSRGSSVDAEKVLVPKLVSLQPGIEILIANEDADMGAGSDKVFLAAAHGLAMHFILPVAQAAHQMVGLAVIDRFNRGLGGPSDRSVHERALLMAPHYQTQWGLGLADYAGCLGRMRVSDAAGVRLQASDAVLVTLTNIIGDFDQAVKSSPDAPPFRGEDEPAWTLAADIARNLTERTTFLEQ